METLAMSVKERRRQEVLSRVKAGEVSLVKGAELLGLSYRQAKRAWARYRDQGDVGLVHGLRGRASSRGIQPQRRCDDTCSCTACPRALYVDRHGIYRADWEPTAEQILLGIEPKTQFGRAMGELDVELIQAHSPQAKGRVERVNRTLQDRLVKELTRCGISDLESANRYLEETYLPRFNQQFGRVAAKRADVHRRVPDERMLRVLSLQEDRVVQPDWTVRWHNGFLQLPRPTAQHVQPGDKVVVSQQLDGRLRIFAAERELPWSPVRAAAPPRPAALPRGPTGSTQGQKPRPNHPWRGRSSPGRRSGVGLLRFGRYAPCAPQSNPPANLRTKGDISTCAKQGTFLMVYNTAGQNFGRSARAHSNSSACDS